MTQEIAYGSLCTGYDGIGMGLRLAGVKVRHKWMAETEPAMSRVLQREHDGVPNVGNIKLAPWDLAPHVAILSSGDPCQSISIAGRQLGRKDERFLWPWVRLAYREVRPDVLFFENVANIVSHDGGRTMAERHEHLRQDGYEVRWTVLGACAVGAPHHRHRYYAVAARSGAAPVARRVGGKVAICGAPRGKARVLLPSPQASDDKMPGTKRMERGAKPWYDLPTHVALLPSPLARDGNGRGEGNSDYWRRRAAEQGRTNGMPLGAAVTMLPTPDARDGDLRGTPSAEHAARRQADPKRSTNLEDAVAARLLPTPKASDGSNGGPNQRDGAGNYYLPGVSVRPDVWGRYADAIALWEQITGIPAPAPTELGTKGSPRMSALLPEWMMGLRPGLLTDELSRAEALKGAGNGVVPLAAAAAWRLCTGPLD